MGTFLERVVVMVQGVAKNFANTMRSASQRVQEYRQNLNKTKRAMRGFKIEMLGIMFFGQMMQRTFLGLLNPVMEAFGVFDLFREMLLILFLPVMEMLFPILMKVFDFFTNLPEPVKKFIGVFTIIGAVLGTVLSLFGQLSLGLGSLGVAFPSLATIAGTAWKAIVGIFSTVGAVITAIIIGMVIAWKENFMGMKDTVKNLINSVKLMFMGLWNMIKGIFNLIKALFTGDVDGMILAFQQLLEGFKQFMTGIVLSIANAIMAVMTGAIRFVKLIFDSVWNIGTSIGDKLANAFKTAKTKVRNAISNMLPDWLRDIFEKGLSLESKIKSKLGGGLLSGVKSAASHLLGVGNKFDDFIVRPGQAPMAINPNDTVIGFKGQPPNMGGKGVVLNQTLNINVANQDLIRREIDNANRRTVNELRRIVKS